jgi:hypothetical protein
MIAWPDATSGWVIYLITIILVGGGAETGKALAHWRRRHTSSDADRVLSTLAAPSIGLLALMIGFTFSMALSRFEARRSAVLIEANAIGTAALRGRMLPEPFRSNVAPLFKEYAMLRVGNKGDAIGSPVITEAVRRSLAIQETLWQTGMDAAMANSQVVPSGLFVQALNTMIDVHEARLTAAQSQVPSVVFVMLDGIAIIAFSFAGYGLELANARCRTGMWIMAVMMGSVIMLVADLDRPQSGFITVDQQPLLNVIDGMR